MADTINPTNDELRRRIAELKGWTIQGEMGGELAGYLPSGARFSRVPNWPENISDTWELEDEIPGNQINDYAEILDRIVHDEFKPYYPSKWDLLHASPRQRCLAWIEWKEKQG